MAIGLEIDRAPGGRAVTMPIAVNDTIGRVPTPQRVTLPATVVSTS